MKILVGTASWSDKSLIDSGKFYPKEATSAEKRLRYYASEFPMVEVDSSYYAIPAPQTAHLWAERTPRDFTFNVKAFRALTGHQFQAKVLPKDLQLAIGAGAENLYYKDLPADLQTALWDLFFAAIEPLRLNGKLGAIHFQFAPWVTSGGPPRKHVEHCVRMMEGRGLMAVEFRNASWWTERNRDTTLAFERERGLVNVVVDGPQGYGTSVPAVWEVTSPELTVVRMHGRNRTFASRIAGCLVGATFAAGAQPRKIPRVGFLRTDPPPQAYIEAFEQGLRERGYTLGKNVLIEYRFGDGTNADTLRLAREIVSSKVDVIVAGGGRATQVAQSVTTTIPIVMTSGTDPGGTGTVASLAHPGGNVTGTKTLGWDLFGKRLELLRQILPKVSRVAVLYNPMNPAPPGAWEEAFAAAATLGVILQQFDVHGPADFDEAFAAMIKGRAEAVVVVQSTIFNTPPYRIAQLAASHRLPAVYGSRITADDGGLMSYGPNNRDSYLYAAVFVDKILKGAKPGDLPVEQPRKFELAINLKTAKALGLTIPQSLLLRADEVIL